MNSLLGVNFLQVATHEIGHSLGLKHSTKADAVMYATYLEYKEDFTLHQDDIAAITAIYNENRELYLTYVSSISVLVNIWPIHVELKDHIMFIFILSCLI